jgi:hypothetical protein
MEGTDWTAEKKIFKLRPPFFGLGDPRAFDSAIRGRLTALAWPDGRQDSDLWEWLDVLKHPGDALTFGSFPNRSVLVAFDRGDGTEPRLIRLSKAPAHVRNLRVAMRGDELLVLWSALVGLDHDDHKAPRVFLARVPLSEVATN